MRIPATEPVSMRAAPVIRELALTDFADSASVERAERAIAWLARETPLAAITTLLACVASRVTSTPWVGRVDDPAGRTRISRAAEEALHDFVTRLPPHALPSLDAAARPRPSSHYANDVWAHWQTWATLDVDRAAHLSMTALRPAFVDRLLSMHPGGHVREAALVRFATHGDDLIPWTIVRALDWVEEISERAKRSALARIRDARDIGPVLDSLALLFRARTFSRADAGPLVELAIERLGRDPDELAARAAMHADPGVQRAALEVLRRSKALTMGRLRAFGPGGDRRVRLEVARAILELARTSGGVDEALVARFCVDRSARLREIGLELAGSVERDDVVRERVSRALDDPDGFVRAAAIRLRSLDDPAFDVRAYYRAAVSRSPPSMAAVRGLSDVGAKQDWELLVPALDARPAVAAAAVQAIRRLDRIESREMRLMMIDSESPAVSRAAARSFAFDVRPNDATVLRDYLGSPRPHVRRHAATLALALPGWAAAELLLPLRAPDLRDLVDRRFHEWLARRFLHGATLDGPSADRLKMELERADVIGANTRREALHMLGLMRRN